MGREAVIYEAKCRWCGEPATMVSTCGRHECMEKALVFGDVGDCGDSVIRKGTDPVTAIRSLETDSYDGCDKIRELADDLSAALDEEEQRGAKLSAFYAGVLAGVAIAWIIGLMMR